MIVLLDNYDSFTYNLVQLMANQGAEMHVVRNDDLTVDDLEALVPAGIVISPGPCTPDKAGISIETVRRFSGVRPILGVCLGHQCIARAFGAVVGGAARIMHGKTSRIEHEESPLYRGLKQGFVAGRYHSLAVAEETLTPDLVVDARSEDGEIMGLHHREHPTYGVQFHPESVLTPSGKRLLRNFLRIVDAFETSAGTEQTDEASTEGKPTANTESKA